MHIDHSTLRGKGWSIDEINHAKGVIEKLKENKTSKTFHERFVYVFLLSLLVLGTIGAMWLIQPVLLLVSPTTGLIIIGVLGLLLGILGSILVKDIEQLDVHHHIIIGIVIPVTAKLTSAIVLRKFSGITSIVTGTVHNSYLLAIVFGIATLVPYLISLHIERKKDETYRMDTALY